MKLYFAGNVGLAAEYLFCEAGLEWRLLSFAEIDNLKDVFRFWASDDAPEPFFLDSGAFGAMTRGMVININRYCDYIEEHEKHLEPYASLDVIGNWQGSARNYDAMRERGLKPIPTFHLNSPLHELERLLKDADYIAMGGLVGSSRKIVEPWLDKCWRVIRGYWPKRVHAFGVTAQWALERYPWYSADSSSSIVGGGLARIFHWDNAKLVAMHQGEYGRRFLDGSILDHVAINRAKNGSAHIGRRVANVKAQVVLQRHITNVWARRGIIWEGKECVASTAQ